MDNAKTTIERLHCDDTLLLVVDIQERLLPVIFECERVVKHSEMLIRAARQLGLPIIVTEQNTERLGPTVPAIREVLGGSEVIGKMLFSACTEETWRAIYATGRRTALVCGIEAHVCMLQTVLDLRERGFTVFVPRDATSSRLESNWQLGWERMRHTGVVPTSTESAVFELLREAGTPDFKALLPFLK